MTTLGIGRTGIGCNGRAVLLRHSAPDIFDTDHGSQFTGLVFTDLLKANGIRISMGGKDCWWDHVLIERLWQITKYEEVYLKAYESVLQVKASLG